jgi:hypothetical protein
MRIRNMLVWAALLLFALAPATFGQAQDKAAAPAAAPAEKKAAPAGSALTDAQKKNLQAYIQLMRTNVRQDKAEIMGAVMALNAQDAAKFWPIYSDYDIQLAKLNDMRVHNIQEYADAYNSMTDAKADELIHSSIEFQKERGELLAATYEKVKQSLGATTAARFAQVEHQLLLIIDLQIDASLPVVGQE